MFIARTGLQNTIYEKYLKYTNRLFYSLVHIIYGEKSCVINIIFVGVK